MKNAPIIQLPLFVLGIIGLMLTAIPVLAEDAAKVQELERIVEAQQKQLDDQRQLLQDLQTQINSQTKDGEKNASTVTTGKTPSNSSVDDIATKKQKRIMLSDEGKHDRDSPTSSNVTYYDPAKAINIPGTNTSIGLHGLLEFQIIHDSVGINNNRFDTATIPVDGGPSQTKFSVNPTQLAISSATPVKEGQINTMISMDFNGKVDSPEPRLRIAYAEYLNEDLGLGFLGGQAYATMLDMRAVPETLDFAMPAGIWQTRQPLVRFTKSHAEGMITEVAIETPENVSYINADKLTRWPDLAVAGTWLFGGEYLKHVRLSGLVRDLRAESGNGATDSAIGWAVSGSAKLALPFLGPKDNFKITLHYGDGYGTQIKGGPQEGAFNLVTSELETIGIFGSYGGIQHFWSERWRSNLVYGYVNADNPGFLSGDTYDNTNYVAADLIWNPFKQVDIGIEYLWGRREDKDGASGTSNRILFTSKVKF
jgi:hypothetical protein